VQSRAVVAVIAILAACAAAAFPLRHQLRERRADGLAVKYGIATKGHVSLAARCAGVMREDYNTSDDPGIAGVPPKTAALMDKRMCELGVQRGLVKGDGTMSEQAGRELALDVIQRIGVARFQTMTYTELATTQYHLAKPGRVTRFDRCVAMGYAGYDAQPSSRRLPPHDRYRRAVRDVCREGIVRGLVPASGAPIPGTPEGTAFTRLLMTKLADQGRS
jgi:hypothetical protein